MTIITHVWCCLCGHGENIPKPLGFGAVKKCVSCGEVYARVISPRGGSAWIRIDPRDVTFHRLDIDIDTDPDEETA